MGSRRPHHLHLGRAGRAAEAALILKPALYFTGIVVDEHGKPISAVKIAGSATFQRGALGLERTASNSDGSFELFNNPVKPIAARGDVGKGAVSFFHPDYIEGKIDDIYAIAPDKRESLRIILETGYKVTGTVLDIAGKPVPNAMVRAVSKDGSHRNATTTDANGEFALRPLGKGLTLLSARTSDFKQRLDLPMAVNSDQNNLQVRLKAISSCADLKQCTVLGMQLTDVTPDLKSAYDLEFDRGVMILDPGTDSERLGLGQLAQRDSFTWVGRTPIGSVREFVNQVLSHAAGQNANDHSVRVGVVFNFRSARDNRTHTLYLKITKDDLKQLQIQSDRLGVEAIPR